MATNLFSDGTSPEHPPDALLLRVGEEGEIVQAGQHIESGAAVYLVEFAPDQIVECLELELVSRESTGGKNQGHDPTQPGWALSRTSQRKIWSNLSSRSRGPAYDINIIGEYKLCGERWQVKPLLDELGIRILSCISGESM